MLEKAINKSQHDQTKEDVLQSLLERDSQLWMWDDKACAVTQIVIYPRKKVCQILYVAGCGMKAWLDDQTITEWAKANGCSQLESFCRDGFVKVLASRGWFKAWTTIRKDI